MRHSCQGAAHPEASCRASVCCCRSACWTERPGMSPLLLAPPSPPCAKLGCAGAAGPCWAPGRAGTGWFGTRARRCANWAASARGTPGCAGQGVPVVSPNPMGFPPLCLPSEGSGRRRGRGAAPGPWGSTGAMGQCRGCAGAMMGPWGSRASLGRVSGSLSSTGSVLQRKVVQLRW